MNRLHEPVMLEEVLGLLAPAPDKRIVDATVGAGGHAEAIARCLSDRGELIVIDRDPEMLERAAKRLAPLPSQVRFVHARMSRIAEQLGEDDRPVDGILLDLGLCSAQLDDPARGFRFGPADSPVPLDMRMDRTAGETASALLERLDEDALTVVLRDGGVPRARAVARAIRESLPVRTAQDLVQCLRGVRLPDRSHHPATLVFQALRIAVNDEYGELERTLEAIPDLLAPGGRLAVLSYHSGEDRRVKEFLAREARGCICPPGLPVCGCGREVRMRVLVSGERPAAEEVSRNPRSRSARLRGGAANVNVKLRSGGRLFRFVAPSLMVVAAAAAIVVWTRTDITATGYRIGRLIDKERSLRTEVEKLRIEATALASPERVERRARAQGLTDPEPGQIVALPSVAAAPDPVEARP